MRSSRNATAKRAKEDTRSASPRSVEAEYNNHRRVPSAEIMARWQAASDAYRGAARAELDQPYGSGERQRYDLFPAGKRPAPLVVYIHGGYWQRGERQGYALLARALNAAGLDLALPSYTLCPAASVMDIVAELRLFLAALWKKIEPLSARHRPRPAAI
jgi:acetyl esterase/lipase